MNQDCFDQFSVIHIKDSGPRTTVFLNTPNEPTALEEREVSKLSEVYCDILISPHGGAVILATSYITVHVK